jgi:agmatinase
LTNGYIDFAAANGWDGEYELLSPAELPSYVGIPSFNQLPVVTDPAAIKAMGAHVAIDGAPLDDYVTHRPGARFGPRVIRQCTALAGLGHSLQVGIELDEVITAVDTGDVNIIPLAPRRGHALVYQRVLEIAQAGAVPIVLGGDHSITWPAASAVAAAAHPRKVGMVHFDAHADTADDTWGALRSHGTPMRRLIESGAVRGEHFVQVGLRGYWPPQDTFDWMREQGIRWHFMHEIEEHGIDHVMDQAIAEALDGADVIYLSIDIDVLDPGSAPGTGTPEPGGMAPWQLLRAVRRLVSQVEMVGMDVMEVIPAYDHADITAMNANRCVMEAISGLAQRIKR